jgi:site-specific recombinase XerD
MDCNDALERFLLSLEANDRSRATIDTYAWRVGHFLEFIETRDLVRLEAIGPEEVDVWAVSLRRQERRYADHPWRPAERGKLSAATIAGRIQAVKAFFVFCVERGYVERSPAHHLRRPRINQSVNGRNSKAMDPDDLASMLAVAEAKAKLGKPRDVALLCFLADTGCRVGELVSLTVDSLHLPAMDAVLNGKTGPVTVDFGGRTAEALRAWLDVRPDVRHRFVFTSLSNDPDSRGQPLTEVGVYQVLRRLAAKAGVRGRFNPHSVRHLVGQLFTDKANLELARRKLNHNQISTTADFYSHQDRERLKAATERFSLVSDDPSTGSG